MPQRGNVGSVGDFMRGELMVDAVSGEEGNIDAIMGEDSNGRSGRAPRGDGIEDSNRLIAIEVGEAGPANYGDVYGFW